MSNTISEPAFALTIALAWTVHVDNLSKYFNSISEDATSSMEKVVWAEELSIGVRLIRNHALRKLTEVDAGKDTDDVPASPVRVVSLLMDQKIRPTLGEKSKLEDILKNTGEFNDPVPLSVQEPIVYEKVYAILKQAVYRRCPELESEGQQTKVTSVLSSLLAEYLASQQHNLSRMDAFEGLASATIKYLKEQDSLGCKWEDVWGEFRYLFACHIELLATHAPAEATTRLEVSKLREMGNNLMINSCYPQAIQVYTEALNKCNHLTRSHVPQLYTNRAIAYIGLNCFPEAVSDLQRALVHDRTCVPAWTQLGYCQLYMGHTIHSLKCYHEALRALGGLIFPYRFPSDKDLRTRYTKAKARMAMPQFVQKLVSSVLLAVKRSNQQHGHLQETSEIETGVKETLNHLKGFASPEDLEFFEYLLDPDMPTLRNSAARADTIRPTILTPDVAQDIMASSNIEASAVTISGPPQVQTNDPQAPQTTQRGAETETETQTQTQTQTEANSQEPPTQQQQQQQQGEQTFQEANTTTFQLPQNYRNVINSLGNIMTSVTSSTQQNSQPPADETLPGQSRGDAGSRPNEAHSSNQGVNNNAAGNGQAPFGVPLNNHFSRALSSVQQALSNSNTVTGDVMSAALVHHQAAIERMFSGISSTGSNIPTRTNGDVQPQPAPGPATVHVVHTNRPVRITGNRVVATPVAVPILRSEREGENRQSQEDTEMSDDLDLD